MKTVSNFALAFSCLLATIAGLTTTASGQSPAISQQGGFTRANVFGGQDYHSPSGKIVSGRPNVFGGQDYSNGLSSRSNVFGGQNYSNGISSRSNVFGGKDYSNGWTSRSNVFGGQDYSNRSGQSFSTRPNVFGGSNIRSR